MPIRKTESRIPAGLQAADLGQAAVAADGRAALVAFAPSPIARGRENTFVVLVTDAAAGAAATVFNWVFEVNGAARPTVQTTVGEIRFQPDAVGTLRVNVHVGGANIALSLEQQVVELNAELETLIREDRRDASAGNPDVARELVNEHNFYYRNVALEPAELSPDPFGQFIFGLVYDGVSRNRPNDRREKLDALARAVNAPPPSDFGRTAMLEGLGAAKLRAALLAMIWPTAAAAKIPFSEFADDQNRRLADATRVRGQLDALAEADKIDLFNLLRFPKTNIVWTAKAIQFLRDRYFMGTNFTDVRTSFNGARSVALVRHFQEGPIRRS